MARFSICCQSSALRDTLWQDGSRPSASNETQGATAQGGEIAARALSTVNSRDGGPSETFVVIDDLPAMVAISSRELDVIEAFLGTLLDDLLK